MSLVYTVSKNSSISDHDFLILWSYVSRKFIRFDLKVKEQLRMKV